MENSHLNRLPGNINYVENRKRIFSWGISLGFCGKDAVLLFDIQYVHFIWNLVMLGKFNLSFHLLLSDNCNT